MIDASIPLQARVGQIEPESNRLARVLALQGIVDQNATRRMAMDEARESRARQNRLREILMSGGGEDELLREGFVTEATTLGKTRRDNRKTDSEIAAKEFEIAKKRLDAGLQAGAALLQSQTPLSRDVVVQALVPHIQSGVLDMNFVTKFVNGLPQDDAAIRQTLKQGMLASMDAAKQLEAMTPKVEYVDLGGSRHPVNTNVNAGEPTNVGGAVPLRKGMSPGDVASNNLAREKFAWERQQPVIVPGVGAYNRTQGGLQPVTDTAGNPIRQPTEQEKDAAKRTGAAGRIIDALDNVGTTADGPVLRSEALVTLATGSWGGAAVDQVFRIFGVSTKGSQAASQLKVLQGNLMLAQPRMEGPQSDRDVNLYREMSAVVGDPTVPAQDKLAALATLRQLQEKYRNKPNGTAQARPNVDAMPGSIRIISIEPGPGAR